MRNSKNENQAISLSVTENLSVQVLPNLDYEFLMTSREVERGYDVTVHSLRMTRLRNSDELTEGKHYVLGKGVTVCYPSIKAQPHQVFWTKRGIVRLGFFVKSKQAKLFRDWAEDLIIKLDEQRNLFNQAVEPKKLPAKRNHNRLTSDRLVSIMAEVCRIDDKELRLSITNKLIGGQA